MAHRNTQRGDQVKSARRSRAIHYKINDDICGFHPVLYATLLKKFQTVTVLVMERPKCRVSCNFCGEELAYHGATSTMNEHLKRKHPVETYQAPKSKQLKLDTCTAHKTCMKKRSNRINVSHGDDSSRSSPAL